MEKVPAAKNMNSHLAQMRAASTTPIGLDTVLLAHWLLTLTTLTMLTSLIVRSFLKLLSQSVKKRPSQDVLHGDEAEEELGLACLVSSYTLPHQNSQPGRRGRQTACSKVLSRRARDT